MQSGTRNFADQCSLCNDEWPKYMALCSWQCDQANGRNTLNSYLVWRGEACEVPEGVAPGEVLKTVNLGDMPPLHSRRHGPTSRAPGSAKT